MSIANQTTPLPISQGVQGSSSLLVVSAAHQPSNHNTYGSDHPNTTRNDSIISPVEMSPNIIHKLLIEMDERIDKLFQQLDGIDNLNVDLEEEHSEMTKLMGYIKNEVNYLTKTTSSSTTKQIPLGKELENLKRSDSFSTDKDSKNLYVKSPVKTPNPEQKSGTKTTIQRMKDLKDQFNAQFKKTIQPKQPEYKKIVRRYLFHRDAVFDIKMSPVCSIDTSTPLFASASADSTCCLWGSNFSHLNPLLVYKGHSGAVNRIKFHPTAQMVCSVSGDQSVHLWKFADTLKQNNALTLNQSNSGNYVGENDDDDDSSNRFKSYFRHSKLPSIDNIHKASTEFDEYNETQHDLFTQDLLDSHIDFKAYQNEGVNTDSENDDSLNELQKYYITEDGVQGMIRNRPTYLRNPHVKNTESHKGIISSCDFTHHNRGDNIITSCWDGCVRILDLELREVQKISSPAETAYLNDVTCAYQSSLIACASSDGNVFLWDSHSDSKSPISSLKSHSDPVNCVAFTPSDRFIITGTDSGELRIFDYRNMTKPVKTVPIKSGGVNNISISEYHQRMLVSLDKRVAKIYDLSGHCHTTLRGHELMVSSACWSYDGSTAFTASIDRQIIQHDVTDGQSQSNVNNED